MIGALHALQGLLATTEATLQAEPPGGATTEEDFIGRSAISVVAGRARLKSQGREHLGRRAHGFDRATRRVIAQACRPP
jgi:hypothetical protein